jgi:DNA adenine methylase
MMRYPGGKLRLQKKINTIISQVYPQNASWVVGEPFTGGGGSLINMAEAFPTWKFHINDFNVEMYTFWKFFTSASEKDMQEFYRLIRAMKPSVPIYNAMFNAQPKDDLERAFRIIFLNKTSYSGYVTQCLPIGGQAQASKWHVDVYWNPETIIKKCERARVALKDKILSVNNLDCNEFIDKYKFNFIYADPPYIAFGKQWYNCTFDINSLTTFREKLDDVDNWCVSMDSLKSTEALFEYDRKEYVKVKHTAKSKNEEIAEAKELVVFPMNTIDFEKPVHIETGIRRVAKVLRVEE